MIDRIEKTQIHTINPMKFRQHWFGVALLLAAWALLTINLGARWYGHQDANGQWISAVMRNYALYGAAEMNFMPVINAGPIESEADFMYNLHPPLMLWLIALLTVPAGLSEAVVRFVPICFTLLGIALFYALSRRLYSAQQARWSAALFTFTPMLLYFGRMPNYEAFTVPLLLAYVVALYDWLRQPTRTAWSALMILSWLTAWVDYAVLFLTAAFALLAWFSVPPKRRLAVVIIAAMPFIATLAHVAFYAYQWNGVIAALLDRFVWRTSSVAMQAETGAFSAFDYSFKTFVRLVILYTPAGVFLGVVGAGMAARRRWDWGAKIMFTWLGGAFAYLLFFRNASFIHDYYFVYLAPPLALAASVALLASRGRRRWQGYLRAAALSAGVVSLIFGASFFSQMHQSADKPERTALIESVRAHTRQDDVILSNLTLDYPVIDYYAFRNLTYFVEPEQALERAETARVIYLYCGGELPAALAAHTPYAEAAGCAYFRLG